MESSDQDIEAARKRVELARESVEDLYACEENARLGGVLAFALDGLESAADRLDDYAEVEDEV